jgi:hypothetical protein
VPRSRCGVPDRDSAMPRSAQEPRPWRRLSGVQMAVAGVGWLADLGNPAAHPELLSIGFMRALARKGPAPMPCLLVMGA